jgi:hypothetical protein
MSDERKKVEHPSWCDRERCTAPEFKPTLEEYRHAADTGAHRSSPVTAYNGRGDLEMFVQQMVCPWDTEAFLSFGMGETGLGSIPISAAGGGFALFEMLAQPIGDLVREYPALYGERFGWVADATSSGEASAETQDVEDEWETLPGVTDTYPSTSAHDNAQHVEEYEDEEALLEPMPYRLTANGRIVTRGTLPEIGAAVAELVTTRLAEAPERVALDAHTINLAFNTGAVEQALAERGEWFTVIDGQGPDPQHIRVTKE